MRPQHSIIALLIFLIGAVHSQEILRVDIGSKLDLEARSTEIRANSETPRELTVLTPTISPEEIDRAVINRLMKEIADEPETIKSRLEISASTMEDIFITISNARSFINNSEIANIRAMCDAWNNSDETGDARIELALDAYKQRDQFTKNFIARYYSIVLIDIESTLDIQQKITFDLYMRDRRKRMATSGTASWGAVVENVTSGRETVNFHCRRD